MADPGGDAPTVYGMAALASDDVWAVGGDKTQFIEHWNGSSWRLVLPAPVPGQYSGLSSLSALAADDVWASGWYDDYPDRGILIEHWDGSTWTVMKTPDRGSPEPTAIAAVSDTDVWAVAQGWPEVFHYDGVSWKHLKTPHVNMGAHSIPDIAATADDGVWIDFNEARRDGSYRLSFLRYDGAAWSVVRTKYVVADYEVFGIGGTLSDDLWAVCGGYIPYGGSHTLTVHYDGSSWARVRSPNRTGASNVLTSVSTTPDGWVLAAGSSTNSQSQPTLALGLLG